MNRTRTVIVCVIGIAIILWRPWRIELWLTPDQQAERFFQAKQFDGAAKLYTDPLRRGIALYRAGDFQNAERAFASDGSAEGAYDRGNALVMLGKYDDAIRSYDRALQLRPEWRDAKDNRTLAQTRKDRITNSGNAEEGTGGEVKPDSIVFDDRPRQNKSQTIEISGGPPLSDEELRTVWLRRVQTKPADFLKARFAYQLHRQETKP